MKRTSTLLAVCLFTMLCGCMLKYEDVSGLPEYIPLLNARFSLKNEMYISGVNLQSGYGKDINIYTIGPTHPSWTGPELIARDTLKSGTILKIQGIRKSINAILFEGKSVQAIVAVEPYKKTINVPVVINLEYINSTNYVSKVN